MSFWKHRGIGRVVAAVVAAALVATLTVASPAGAANKTLSFGETPTDWSITSGEAEANLGKIAASGVKKNRIRYSLAGADGFSVKARSGVVSYDGTAIPAGEALVTVTARDRKGKRDAATVTITVAVTAAQPALQVERYQPPPQPHEQHSAHEHIKIKVNTRRPMIAEGHRQAVMARFTADVPDGTVVTWSIVNGGDVTPYEGAKVRSAKDGFQLRKDTGVLEYTGSSAPFGGTGSRTLTASGDKDYYEYFLQVKATAPKYADTTIDIRVCLLR